ncbi:hypothetical protein [Massilia sp. S19_KUP03_FR1]
MIRVTASGSADWQALAQPGARVAATPGECGLPDVVFSMLADVQPAS